MRVFAERLHSYWGLLALFLLTSGCGKQQLYGTLPEKEANEMMAILIENNVACTKEPGEEDGSWKLSVEQNQFADAVEILNEFGRPRDKFVSIEDLFPKTGLVSSPAEQRIRLTYGLEQSLAKTITEIPNVISARVHLVLPNNDPLSGESVQPSSASVVIIHRPDADSESLVTLVKQIVINGIAELDVGAVSVELVEAEESLLGGRLSRRTSQNGPKLKDVLTIQVAEDSVGRLLAVLIAAAAVFLIGVMLTLVSLMRRRPGASQPA